MISRILRGMMGLGIGSGAIALMATAASAEPHTAFLSTGEVEVYEAYFLAGEDIYASCDIDCEDLDIYLYDAYTGELIEADTLIDAEPVVTAPYEGTFLVETTMVTCYAEICEAWTDSDGGF